MTNMNGPIEFQDKITEKLASQYIINNGPVEFNRDSKNHLEVHLNPAIKQGLLQGSGAVAVGALAELAKRVILNNDN